MITLTLGAITGIFVLLLALQWWHRWRFCAICAAVSITWIGLLTSRALGLPIDPTVIALLMGQSAIGIFYLFENHARRRWLVFRLPLLLTLTAAAYTVATWELSASTVILVMTLWAAFGIIGALRTPRVKALSRRIVNCCKQW